MSEDGFERRGDGEGGEDVYSKVVRAGRRTYFFDVKATRGDDYFLTITESRKKTLRDGSAVFEKNKIYLYKEDFAKFADGYADVVAFIKRNKPEFFEGQDDEAAEIADNSVSPATDVTTELTEDASLDAEFDAL
jgi:hypothetical protein